MRNGSNSTPIVVPYTVQNDHLLLHEKGPKTLLRRRHKFKRKSKIRESFTLTSSKTTLDPVPKNRILRASSDDLSKGYVPRDTSWNDLSPCFCSLRQELIAIVPSRCLSSPTFYGLLRRKIVIKGGSSFPITNRC
jgi:hypothetical protein